MENSKEDNSKKEPNKTICNRCMSDMTGISDIQKDKGIEIGMDLSAIIDHMEFSLDNAVNHVNNDEISTSMIFHTYIHNDIMLLKDILGLNNEECDCCGGEDAEEEEDV